MKSKNDLKVCKRCNRANTKELICQSCKIELLNHYEATSDWKIAFEIERVQLYTSKYFTNEENYDNY
jgi:hypothetical protein